VTILAAVRVDRIDRWAEQAGSGQHSPVRAERMTTPLATSTRMGCGLPSDVGSARREEVEPDKLCG